jgi:hypothetical protein
MWMNEGQIDEAKHRYETHPTLGPATRFLSEWRHEVNAHSDGWPYWTPPSKAAERLMQLIHAQMRGGMGAYPKVAEPTIAEVKKTLVPIRAFMFKRGAAAGMKMPNVDFDNPKREEVKATLIIQVAYKMGTATRQYVKETLEHAAANMADSGLLTGEGEAEVEAWGYSVQVR